MSVEPGKDLTDAPLRERDLPVRTPVPQVRGEGDPDTVSRETGRRHRAGFNRLLIECRCGALSRGVGFGYELDDADRVDRDAVASVGACSAARGAP